MISISTARITIKYLFREVREDYRRALKVLEYTLGRADSEVTELILGSVLFFWGTWFLSFGANRLAGDWARLGSMAHYWGAAGICVGLVQVVGVLTTRRSLRRGGSLAGACLWSGIAIAFFMIESWRLPQVPGAAVQAFWQGWLYLRLAKVSTLPVEEALCTAPR